MGKTQRLVNNDYINLTAILSYSTAIFYFIDTVRNIGKTWAICKMAWRRSYKHGKKTILVRRFRKEAQSAASALYQSSDIREFCKGLEVYDPKTKKGNFKKSGRTMYIKKNGKWEWFLKVAYVSDAQSFRSADDVNCNLILYDEYTTTPARYARYRGTETEDFIDLVVSIARKHKVRCIFTGNKESHSNPYYEYLGITPPPGNFEGIRRYKKGSIVIYQRNIPHQSKSNKQFEDSLMAALSGTAYAEYLYQGAYKHTPQGIKYYRTPPDAEGYLQVSYKGQGIKITQKGDTFYVNSKPDATLGFLTDTPTDRKYDIVYNPRLHKARIRALETAITLNKVRYDNATCREIAHGWYAYAGIAPRL